jgi:RHS repeat-associated protein
VTTKYLVDTLNPTGYSQVLDELVSGAVTRTYDAAGNLLLDSPCPSGSFTPTYEYDAENRQYNPLAEYSYFYDADGVRIRKAASATVGTMYWPGPNGEYLMETNGSGAISEEYLYFNGARIARVDRPSGTVHYYFSNHLGSASVITDASGNIVDQTDYFPFGGAAYTSGSDPNHYKFTGKERDTESGLDNFTARYFGSSMGRFMSPDPDEESGIDNMGDPQMWNGYSYVGNNPLNRTDPSGRTVSICDTNGNYCQAVSDEDYAKAQQQDQYNHAASLDQLKQNDGSFSNITDSSGNVVGTVMYTHDENAPTEGAEPLGEKMIAGYALGAGIGKAFGAAWGAVAGWFGRGAEAGGTAAGEAAGQLGVRAGGVIDRVFQTSSGPVRVYAEVVAEGQTAVIKDVAIYPAASETGLQVGYTQMRQGLNGVLSDLKAQGFTQARIEAYRVSGAVPGRTMNLTVTLK